MNKQHYSFKSATSRAKIPLRDEPFWLELRTGLCLGYRRGVRGGYWYRRQWSAHERKYQRSRIGKADDGIPADKVEVFDFDQAISRARDFVTAIRPDVKTVRDAIELYLAYQKDRATDRGYITTDSYVRNHILMEGTVVQYPAEAPRLADVQLAALSKDLIDAWLKAVSFCDGDQESKRRKRATANRAMTTLRAALTYATENPAGPWSKVEPLGNIQPPKTTERRPLTYDESARLLIACEPDFRFMVQGALETGARYSELCNARVRDYNPQEGYVYFRQTKTSNAKNVYLAGSGVELFENLTGGKEPDDRIFLRDSGRPWTLGPQQYRMKMACRRAKISRLTFHSLRRTFGTNLANSGMPPIQLQQQMGHKSLKMTEVYYLQVRNQDLARNMRDLSPDYGSG